MMILVDYGEMLTFFAMFIASILAVAVTAERIIIFKKNSYKKNAGLIEGVIEKIRLKDMTNALKITTAHSESLYTRFLSFAIEHYSKGPDSLYDLMAGHIIREKIELEKRLLILNTLGNNAPFIGLLGTVLGVIKAFYSLGALGNTGAEVVMKNISTALLATAGGLFIAIPVVMANNYFTKKLKVIDQYLEILSKEFIASLSTLHGRTRSLNAKDDDAHQENI